MGRVAKQHLLGVPRGSSPGALRNSWRLDVTVRPGALLWGAVRAGLAQAPHLGVEEEEGTCPDVGGCQRPKPVCVQPPRGDCVGGSLTQPGTESVDTCLFPSSTHPPPDSRHGPGMVLTSPESLGVATPSHPHAAD